MSEEETDAADTSLSCCCASCGIAEIDDIKLVPCDGCDLVKYCSDECRVQHKSEHNEDCKSRAAELRDELLFKQPEGTHLGDCPICSLPLPLDPKKSTMYECCSKVICNGCRYADQIREHQLRLRSTCPFCREPMPRTDEEYDKLMMKRAEANDRVAMCQKAVEEREQGHHSSAIEYWTKAAGLGNADAHYNLSVMYDLGEGVEKDEEKYIHHLEEAAIGGHPKARYNFGCIECSYGSIERAVKNWIISATQGHDLAIKKLMEVFKKGFMAKEDLTAALRAHKAAVDATKSPKREEAEEYYRILREES